MRRIGLVLVAVGTAAVLGGLAWWTGRPPSPSLAVPGTPFLAEDTCLPGDDTAAPPGEPSGPELHIVDWPIPFGEERMRLTVDYLRHHIGGEDLTGDLETDTTMVPRVIVLHWTAGPTAISAWWAFAPERSRRRHLDPEQAVNLSSQFIVDRDGTVYRLMPETRIARHTIGLNQVAIGVENVGGIRRYPLTDAQVAADAALIRDLVKRYPITHLIGHYEYRRMEGHPYFRERDPDFRTQKIDPGEDFMAKVRAAVADLGLQGPPDQSSAGD